MIPGSHTCSRGLPVFCGPSSLLEGVSHWMFPELLGPWGGHGQSKREQWAATCVPLRPVS